MRSTRYGLLKAVKTRTLPIIGITALLSGFMFYLVFRADRLPLFFNSIFVSIFVEQLPPIGWQRFIHPGSLADDFLQAYPSALHAFLTVLAIRVWCQRYTRWSVVKTVLITVSVLIAAERCFGWFSGFDVLAILAGAALAVWIPSRTVAGSLGSNRASPHVASLVLVLLTTGSAALTTGSYVYNGYYTGECARYDEEGFCLEYKRPGVPVYITYQRLRESVAIEAARPPDRLGRVYLYQDFIFLNERNEGIHIIDNRSPASPVNLGFIRIPGNTELAIRDNYLYADSYVDLVTLDLTNPLDIVEIDRQVDIFPWDAFQNVPNNISFSQADTDSSRGVIVSYRLVE